MKKQCVCQNPKCGKAFIKKIEKTRQHFKAYCCRKCFTSHDRDPAERFWRFVTKGEQTSCWLWIGAKTVHGYGGFVYYNRDENGYSTGRVSVVAHRFSYELIHDPIEYPYQVLHKCDNRLCVNPAHLFVGTLQDNMTDRNAKGRHAHGESHARAKLTEIQVRAIRQQYADGQTQVNLSKQFSISRWAIRSIIDGRAWRHIT